MLSIPMSDIQSVRGCVTLCNKHPEIIGMELPKPQYTEEADVDVSAVALLSLMPYNTWTTAYYIGLASNIISFQLVPTNPKVTPVFLGVSLLMHMSTYRNQHMEVDEVARGPTDSLDLHIGNLHMECIQPTNVEI